MLRSRLFPLALAAVLATPLLVTTAATPAITDVVVDVRATSALLTYRTSEPVPTRVEYAVDGGATRSAGNATPATEHAVLLTHLSPGAPVTYSIVADASTLAGAFTTTTSLTYYLHNRGAALVLSADEFDSAGDNDGRGYNGFGAAVSTAQSATGVVALDVTDEYPAQNGALLLAPGSGSARLYVKFTLSGPTVSGVGTTVARGSPAAASFRVSALSGGEVVATGVGQVVVAEVADRYVPVDVPLATTGAAVREGDIVLSVAAETATAGYVFGFEGDHASRVTLPVEAGVPVFPVEPRKADFTQGARVVVAVIDSGINPYHPQFRRPGASMPLADLVDAQTGLQPRAVDLSDSGTYRQRVDADDAAWDSIGARELVWFRNTNVLGVSIRGPEHNEAQQTINATAAEKTNHRVRDVNGHGTAAASTVLSNFPDAIVVMVQITTGAGLADATRWAAEQPWIDVVSTSWGTQANLPSTSSQTPRYTRQAYDAGKVVVNSAGNDPSPLPTDSQDGPHWVIAVTGTQAEGRSKEVLSANVYPDYAADYTVRAAVMDNADDVYVDIGGTSFSCPTVAGTIAGIVYKLRESTAHAGGIVDGELAPGVTNRDVRAALNKTAIIPPWSGYVVGTNWNGDHLHAPGAEFTTIQWGHVDDRVIQPTVDAILADDYAIPFEKTAVAAWKAATWEYRAAYWE